jgi:type 1 glutamine amidotransferase
VEKLSHRNLADRRQFLRGCAAATTSIAADLVTRLAGAGPATPLFGRPPRPKQLLLIGGPFDGHPKGTHEYMAGLPILARCLEAVPGLKMRITNSEEPWRDGPPMIDSADGVVLFREQGARFIQGNNERLAAFERLAQRGGGCVALHFGMGTVEARFIERFVNLFGACHGGPDRRTHTAKLKLGIAAAQHPACRGIGSFEAHDEFYHKLKRVELGSGITPIVQAEIEGHTEMVGWAWQRSNGGRSFGFSGLHYHENWRLPEYRRLVAQGTLWTLQLPIPKEGINVAVPARLFGLRDTP